MYQKISNKTKYVFEIRAGIIAVLFALLTALLVPRDTYLFFFLTAFWVLLFILYICVYIPLRQVNTFFSISQNIFRLNTGVLYYTTKSMDLDRVQYVVTKSCPLEKLFGLVSLVIYAPGGKITVSCVDQAIAPAIVETLCNPMRKNGGKSHE